MTKPLSNCRSAGSMHPWRLLPARSTGRGEVIARHQSLKPYWGKPTVRNFSGGAGNVRDGRTRTPLHISKEWRVETLGLRLRAPVLYSTESFSVFYLFVFICPSLLGNVGPIIGTVSPENRTGFSINRRSHCYLIAPNCRRTAAASQ